MARLALHHTRAIPNAHKQRVLAATQGRHVHCKGKASSALSARYTEMVSEPRLIELSYRLTPKADAWVLPEAPVPKSHAHNLLVTYLVALLSAWVERGQRDGSSRAQSGLALDGGPSARWASTRM